jgi:antitoxin component YwqK of YwqJK toxin-antitoxin module
MKYHSIRALSALLLCMSAAGHAAQVCDIDGQVVGPNSRNDLAGKTGVMRCRDGEGGPLLRERELQNGKFAGVTRDYKAGVLHREYSLDDSGRREGRNREFAATSGGNNPVLLDETYRDGSAVGIGRNWFASGQLKRVQFNADKGYTVAYATFTADGKLKELLCSDRVRLAPHADDARWCGHSGNAPAAITLYSDAGKVSGSVTYEKGELRKREQLGDNGKPLEQMESTREGGIERHFSEQGIKRREVQWVNQVSDGRAERITILERDYHETGPLEYEQRWTPTARDRQLTLEQRWYLNGQPRAKREFLSVEGKPGLRDTQYHDNGQVASEGVYKIEGRYDQLAVGIHKGYDANGRLRLERHYDAGGRLSRERELSEVGAVIRDEALFADGSRKAFSR